MRTIAFILGMLTPAVALAAIPPIGQPAIDAALSAIDHAFEQGQEALAKAPLDDRKRKELSNVLKTKHDTVKNSINNIR